MDGRDISPNHLAAGVLVGEVANRISMLCLRDHYIHSHRPHAWRRVSPVIGEHESYIPVPHPISSALYCTLAYTHGRGQTIETHLDVELKRSEVKFSILSKRPHVVTENKQAIKPSVPWRLLTLYPSPHSVAHRWIPYYLSAPDPKSHLVKERTSKMHFLFRYDKFVQRLFDSEEC